MGDVVEVVEVLVGFSPTVIVTVLLGAAGVPPVGLWEITMPHSDGFSVWWYTMATTNPWALRADSAAERVSPTTF